MPSETLRYLLALWIVSLSVMSIGFILSGPRASPLPRGYFLVDNTSDSLVAAAAAAAAVYLPRPVGWWGFPSTSISQQPRFLRGSDATSRRESDTLAHEFWMYTNTNTEHILTHTSGNSRHPTSQVTAVPQSERDHNDPQTVWLKADEVSEKTLFVCREIRDETNRFTVATPRRLAIQDDRGASSNTAESEESLRPVGKNPTLIPEPSTDNDATPPTESTTPSQANTSRDSRFWNLVVVAMFLALAAIIVISAVVLRFCNRKQGKTSKGRRETHAAATEADLSKITRIQATALPPPVNVISSRNSQILDDDDWSLSRISTMTASLVDLDGTLEERLAEYLQQQRIAEGEAEITATIIEDLDGHGVSRANTSDSVSTRGHVSSALSYRSTSPDWSDVDEIDSKSVESGDIESGTPHLRGEVLMDTHATPKMSNLTTLNSSTDSDIYTLEERDDDDGDENDSLEWRELVDDKQKILEKVVASIPSEDRFIRPVSRGPLESEDNHFVRDVYFVPTVTTGTSLGLDVLDASCEVTHPIVSSIHEQSPLTDRVFEGDILLAVNESETAGWTNTKISTWMAHHSKTSAAIKLTIMSSHTAGVNVSAASAASLRFELSS